MSSDERIASLIAVSSSFFLNLFFITADPVDDVFFMSALAARVRGLCGFVAIFLTETFFSGTAVFFPRPILSA